MSSSNINNDIKEEGEIKRRKHKKDKKDKVEKIEKLGDHKVEKKVKKEKKEKKEAGKKSKDRKKDIEYDLLELTSDLNSITNNESKSKLFI